MFLRNILKVSKAFVIIGEEKTSEKSIESDTETESEQESETERE